MLVVARRQKKRNNVTVPFTYLGPVDRVSYESERPIKMVWRLRHPMPVEMFEDNRRWGRLLFLRMKEKRHEMKIFFRFPFSQLLVRRAK